jgi:ADP-heptose:LPS heptosyltransferase
MTKAFFVGCNALGDTLCTTPAIQAYRKANPHTFITYIVHNAPYCRVLDGNPDIDLVIYNERLWLGGMGGFSWDWFYSLPLDILETGMFFHLDMDLVCAREESFHEHITLGIAKVLGIRIDSVRPVLRLSDMERRAARSFVRRPYVVFSRHSNANPKRAHGVGAKDWPDENWRRLAKALQASGLDVISVGAETDVRFASPDARDLYGLPIKVIGALLETAACLVTLENGIAHLGAAVDVPMVELYSKIVPQEWAYPLEMTRREVIYADPSQISFDQVAEAVGRILRK